MRGHVLASLAVVGLVGLGLWYLAPRAVAEDDSVQQAALAFIAKDVATHKTISGTWATLGQVKQKQITMVTTLSNQAAQAPLTKFQKLAVSGLLTGMATMFQEWDNTAQQVMKEEAYYQTEIKETLACYTNGQYFAAGVGANVCWEALVTMQGQVNGCQGAADSIQTSLNTLADIIANAGNGN